MNQSYPTGLYVTAIHSGLISIDTKHIECPLLRSLCLIVYMFCFYSSGLNEFVHCVTDLMTREPPGATFIDNIV